MTLHVFISSVTDRTAAAEQRPDPLRSWLIDRLKKSGSYLVHQESLIETGVNTLVKLAREIEHQHVVIHIVTSDPGRIPTNSKIVVELLRHCDAGKLRQRFQELFVDDRYQRLTYTQWEAWLGKFYERDVVCFCLPDAETSQVTASPDSLSMQEHLAMLKPHAGYAVDCDSREDLLSQIQTVLLRHKNNDRDVQHPALSRLAIRAILAIVLLLTGILVSIQVGLFRTHHAAEPVSQPNNSSTVLFAQIGAASDLERLRAAAEHDARDTMAECVTTVFQQMARSKDLSDSDLKRFIDVYLECQTDVADDLLAFSSTERAALHKEIEADPMQAAQQSPNPLIRKLGIEFSKSPATLSHLLKELIHE